MNGNINNKGFTLVELLAVMVILISISLISVVTITSSLERRDEKECDEQIELAIGAAKIYFSLKEGSSSVSISTLISDGYITDSKKVDRLTDGTIIIGTNSYDYNGTCN